MLYCWPCVLFMQLTRQFWAVRPVPGSPPIWANGTARAKNAWPVWNIFASCQQRSHRSRTTLKKAEKSSPTAPTFQNTLPSPFCQYDGNAAILNSCNYSTRTMIAFDRSTTQPWQSRDIWSSLANDFYVVEMEPSMLLSD